MASPLHGVPRSNIQGEAATWASRPRNGLGHSATELTQSTLNHQI